MVSHEAQPGEEGQQGLGVREVEAVALQLEAGQQVLQEDARHLRGHVEGVAVPVVVEEVLVVLQQPHVLLSEGSAPGVGGGGQCGAAVMVAPQLKPAQGVIQGGDCAV